MMAHHCFLLTVNIHLEFIHMEASKNDGFQFLLSPKFQGIFPHVGGTSRSFGGGTCVMLVRRLLRLLRMQEVLANLTVPA